MRITSGNSLASDSAAMLSKTTAIVDEELLLKYVNDMKSFMDSSTYIEERAIKIAKARLATSKVSDPKFDSNSLLNEMVNAYFDDFDNRESPPTLAVTPVQGCAEKPKELGPIKLRTSSTMMDQGIPLADSNSIANREQSDLDKAIQMSLQVQNSPQLAPLCPRNPLNDKRDYSTIGVKNIGQTCWFSVLAQMLYNIPSFRTQLYNLFPKNIVTLELEMKQDDKRFSKKHLIPAFRQLFSVMEAGQRRYADPTKALRVISHIQQDQAKTTLLGHQQDAVEMLTILLDWLESEENAIIRGNASKTLADPSTSEGEKMSNEGHVTPLQSLLIAEKLDADDMMDTSPLGSPPSKKHQILSSVDVNFASSNNDIPVAMEGCDSPPAIVPSTSIVPSGPTACTFHGTYVEIKNSQSNTNTSVPLFLLNVDDKNLMDALEHHCFNHGSAPGTELWFDSLPPVLIMSLKRFRYEAVTKKIHSPFIFPESFFMDRFMTRNADIVRNLLKERSVLLRELNDVRARLMGFERFPLGIDGSKGPLLDILRSFLWYASGCSSDFFVDESTAVSENESVCSSHEILFPSAMPKLNEVYPKPCLPTQQNSIACGLKDILDDATAQHQKLIERERELATKIDGTFNDDQLQREEYELHSIVIHDGENNMGHYWSYTKLRSEGDDLWVKMNDASVEVVSFEQISRDGWGELPTTSAYFTVYIKKAERNQLLSDIRDSSFDVHTSAFSNLPFDLQCHVSAENVSFERECASFKLKTEYKKRPLHELSIENLPLADRKLVDEINIRCKLSEDAFELFDADISTQFRTDIMFLRTKVDACVPNAHRETITRLVLSGVMRFAILPRLAAIHPAFQNPQSDEQLAASLLKIDSDQVQGFIDKIFSEWFEFERDNDNETFPPMDLLSFWHCTGLGFPAKILRCIVLGVLCQENLGYLSSLSLKETHGFEKTKVYESFKNYFDRMLADFTPYIYGYDLIKNCLSSIMTAETSVTAINDFRPQWLTAMRYARAAVMCFELMFNDLEKHANLLGLHIRRPSRLINELLLRAVVIMPFLRMFQLFVYLSCVTNTVHEMDEGKLSKDCSFRELAWALEKIVVWSRGRDGHETLMIFCQEILSFVEDMLKEINVRAQKESQTSLEWAYKLEEVILGKQVYGSLENTATISHQPSLSSIIQEIEEMKLAMCLTTESDAVNQFVRITTETQDLLPKIEAQISNSPTSTSTAQTQS